MRITYRSNDNKSYWTKRWDDIPADSAMANLNAYPLKYAEMTISGNSGRILEAGCGAGRVLRYYHELGFDILGIDFIEVAIEKLRNADSSLNVEVADITNLKFPDGEFKYVLAFGLYHNLEENLDVAIKETYRILETGGMVCASFRADNVQTRLTDWLASRRSKADSLEDGPQLFHKMNLRRDEFKRFFSENGFEVQYMCPVENFPLLYKFSIFRHRNHKIFDENLARKEGYRLSRIGKLLQGSLMRWFPNQFCNIYVLIGRKK